MGLHLHPVTFTQMPKIVSFLLSFFLVAGLYAAPVFDFTPTCQKAYDEMMSLRLKRGQALIDQARKENPENLIPVFLESYQHFFILFFNEDPAEYKWRRQRFAAILDQLEEGSTASPYQRYTRSLVYLQRAVVSIKFSEKFGSAMDLRRCFSLIKDNRKAHPQFAPNQLVYGPVQVAAGVIPDGYKWLASLFGIKGSVKQGMTILRQFLQSKDPQAMLFMDEANFYYTYLKFYVENQQAEAIQHMRTQRLDVVNNHLFAYQASNLALNAKQTDYSLRIIQARRQGPEYLSTPVWDFEQGYAYLHKLDLAKSAQHFETYLRVFKGKFYVKDAAQKLSWCHYLMGNTAAAEQARKMVMSRGGTDTDADKKALKDARTGIWPNVLLLKARLLNDGGYNTQALDLLLGKSAADFGTEAERLEFFYRVARIYDELNRDTSALQFYQKAIDAGRHRTEHYAARAALQMGMIYEKQGKLAEAIKAYNEVLDMDDHDFKDSLDQKAKSGLARCKGQ